MDTFESLNDFIKDAGPVFSELGVEAIHKLYEFEQKGYFDYIRELNNLLGQIHKHYTVDDLKELSNNIDVLLRILKNVSSEEMLNKAEKATAALAKTNPGEEDKTSTLGLLREINKPETRQSLAFSLRLLKSLTKEEEDRG